MKMNALELVELMPLSDECINYDYGELVESISDDIQWVVKTNRHTKTEGMMYFFGEDSVEEIYYFVAVEYDNRRESDMIYNCTTVESMEYLRNAIKKNIVEFESVAEFTKWMNDEGKTCFWGRGEDLKDFVDQMNILYT